MILAATGHRPEKLGGYDQKTRRALGALAVEYLHETKPKGMIVGMAQGWDQAVAAASIVLGIPFTAAVPFSGQADTWPAEAQVRYRRLLAAADQVIVTAAPDIHSISAKLQYRNEWMVDRADAMLALWDGSWGGTFNCIRYAEKIGVPVINLWDRWSFPEDLRDLLG